MKIAIEIKADGEYCGECWAVEPGEAFCQIFVRQLEWELNTDNVKRCRQCIEATIESDGE